MKRCNALTKTSGRRCRKWAGKADLCPIHTRMKRQGRKLETVGEDWEPQPLNTLEQKLEAVREKLDPGPLPIYGDR